MQNKAHCLTKYKPLIFIILIGVLFFAGSFMSLQEKKETQLHDQAMHLVLQQTKGMVVLDKHFPAIDNLEGFLVHFKNNPQQKAIIYADKQGHYMFTGHIIMKNGIDITHEEYQTLLHPSHANTKNHSSPKG